MNDNFETLKNYNKFENILNDDIALADPVADNFKNADDALDFIRDFIACGYTDDFYYDQLKMIKDDIKNGHDYLYTDNEGSTGFEPVGYMSFDDFVNYDLMIDPSALDNNKLHKNFN